jgi:hypothetical protein
METNSTCVDGRRATDAADVDGDSPRRSAVASRRCPGSESQLDVTIGGKETHAATGRREGVGYLRANGGEARKEDEAVIAGAPAGAAAIATALRTAGEEAAAAG